MFKPEVLEASSLKKDETKLYSKTFMIPIGIIQV